MNKKISRAKFCLNNKVELIYSGKPFFSLLAELINQAKESIHVQTYILGFDDTGRSVVDSLIKAASRKVNVYLLVDGFASQDLPDDFIKEMKDAGVKFRFFEPLFSSKSLYFGRRLHHKVVVVDNCYALVGGLNLADRYNDTKEQRAWLDIALYVKGEVAGQLELVCRDFWKKGRARQTFPAKQECVEDFGKHEVRISRNDWVRTQQGIWNTYLEIFGKAEKNITIMTSYFLPGEIFRRNLKKAVKRGVRIKVILACLSDVKTAKYAERYLYRWMLRNGIEIYEYQPTNLHAKMAISDDKLVTVGSYNINNISAFASIEMNLDVKDKAFCKMVQKELDEIIEKDCKPINDKTYTTKLFSFKQLVQWSCFQFIRLMLTLTTFYFKQR